MRVLVTGAAGFVGWVAAQAACERGWNVTGISRSKTPPQNFSGKWRPFSWTQGAQALSEILGEHSPEIIVHAAGSASVQESFKDPVADFQASVGTLSTLLEAVRNSQIAPVVMFPSSAAVYGNPKTLPISEDSSCRPVSPYGWHKHLCEELARAHASLWGTQIVIARMFSVLGPTQRRLLVWELADRLQKSGEIELLGSGHETRDYLYEKEMANALLDLALVQQARPRQSPVVVNVASGIETTTLNVAQTLAQIVAPDCSIVCRGNARPGDPERWCADITLLRSLLPEWNSATFAESLGRTLQAWRSERLIACANL